MLPQTTLAASNQTKRKPRTAPRPAGKYTKTIERKYLTRNDSAGKKRNWGGQMERGGPGVGVDGGTTREGARRILANARERKRETGRPDGNKASSIWNALVFYAQPPPSFGRHSRARARTRSHSHAPTGGLRETDLRAEQPNGERKFVGR